MRDWYNVLFSSTYLSAASRVGLQTDLLESSNQLPPSVMQYFIMQLLCRLTFNTECFMQYRPFTPPSVTVTLQGKCKVLSVQLSSSNREFKLEFQYKKAKILRDPTKKHLTWDIVINWNDMIKYMSDKKLKWISEHIHTYVLNFYRNLAFLLKMIVEWLKEENQ